MIKIKICGLKRKEDISFVNKLQPDYIGFVFAPSSRQITAQQARELKSLLAPTIKAVGVFVNASMTEILSLAANRTIDLIQLHGDETPKYVDALLSRTKLPIIKAIRLKDERELETLAEYDCDYFLFDAYSPLQYGGTGELVAGDLLRRRKFSKPFFLAGGLKSDNLDEATRGLMPFALDVSGGVETAGVKDYEKIENFIRNGRHLKSVIERENISRERGNNNAI